MKRAPYSALPRSTVLAVVAANMGISGILYAGIANLLPRQIELVASDSGRFIVLGVVTGIGAAVALIANLVAGFLSDRWNTPLGRRRPWIIGGLVVGAVGFASFSQQTHLPGVGLSWAVTQLGVSCALAGTSAIVPDHAPHSMLGVLSGVIGLGQVCGVLLAATLISVSGTVGTGAWLVAAAYVLLLLPLSLLPALAHEERRPKRSANPLVDDDNVGTYADFWWAWLTRFVVTLSNSIAILYIYYYLSDVLALPNASQRQLPLVAVAAGLLAAAATVCGRLSDKARRRKVFVAWSCVVLAGAELIFAVFKTWPAAMLASALVGLGYGTYLAVDQALITEVLPNSARYARDLGIMNLANAGPQVAAPGIASLILSTSVGYTGLYVIVAAITLLGVLFVAPIRGVL